LYQQQRWPQTVVVVLPTFAGVVVVDGCGDSPSSDGCGPHSQPGDQGQGDLAVSWPDEPSQLLDPCGEIQDQFLSPERN